MMNKDIYKNGNDGIPNKQTLQSFKEARDLDSLDTYDNFKELRDEMDV